MRLYTIMFIGLLIISNALFADEETLLSGDFDHGGFGGPSVMLTQINGEGHVLVGGRGGWIINHTITIGGGGYGLSTEFSAEIETQSTGLVNALLNFGYGGFEMGYIHRSERITHFDFHILIGSGAVSWRENGSGGIDTADEYYQDGFFVLEPSAMLEINIVKWMRANLGVSYRYINNAAIPQIKESNLTGPSLLLGLKFGSF